MTALPRITGTTRLYVIVGDPIVQVRSAEVFTARFARAGMDAVLVAAQVPPDRFETAIPGLMALGNLDGLLVTLPFKNRMLPYADRLGVTAECIGALNALRREPDGTWTGDMFDGAGFAHGAEAKGYVLRARRVALFGAGGAGSAIACALAERGAASITVIDPETARSAELAARLQVAFPACRFASAPALPGDVDMIVNASPIGMRPGDGLPGEIGHLDADTLVGDSVVSSTPTALVRMAMDRGCAWVNGHDMHAGQVDAIMEFFAPGRASAPATDR